MLRVMVAFASREGQTERIAHHVAREVENRGALSHLVNVRVDPVDDGVDDYDAAVLADSLHIGQYDPVFTAFVESHLERLNAVPSLMLTISLSAASPDAAERESAVDRARTLISAMGWRPGRMELVGGAVNDRKLNFLQRWLMHLILRRKGVEPDPSGNSEFTDWKRLDSVVAEFVRDSRDQLAGSAGAPSQAAS